MKLADLKIIKVCGMRDPDNIGEIVKLQPDYIGFIFYEKSPRYVGAIDPDIIRGLPEHVVPVGVFVNESIQKIIEITKTTGINTIQLHGSETPEFCKILKKKGYKIIKAISIPVEHKEDLFRRLESYQDNIDLFLFDTAGKAPGGNGVKFNRNILEDYDLEMPYLLSGGIGPEDINFIKQGLPRNCVGIDLNSRFEIYPGFKDSSKLSFFIKEIR